MKHFMIVGVVLAMAISSRAETTWYVDAEHGNDSWNGKADYANAVPASNVGPKKTLAVFTDLVRSGDTIYAAPGWYTNGVVTSGSRFRLYTSPGNIKLISTGSAADTFIGGAVDGTVVQNVAPFGCGSNGVVPVKMLGGNNVIRGFTITDGRQTQYENHDSYYGGGVVFSAYTDSLIDCVVTNCIANRGGGVKYGNALRCRFTNNHADNGAHGLYVKNAVNCIFENTQGYAIYNNTVNGTFVNCLFRGNKVGNVRANDPGVISVYNSVFLKDDSGTTPMNRNNDFYNCFFDYDPTVVPNGNPIIGTNSECRIFPTGSLTFNADGSPTKLNPVVDAGIASYYDDNFPAVFDASEKAFDFYKNARTVGAAMDIGAVERVSGTRDENAWFVDAVNGNDSWDGRADFANADPANNIGPKKTLAVFTNLVAKGDAIYAAPGWYTNGVCVSGTSRFRFYTTASCISLVATGSAADTFIGGTADETVKQDVDPFGCGPAAIVPIKMTGGGNLIRGFTITGGRQTQYTNHDTYYGGGVIFTTTAFTDSMVDCVVTNCIANRGGGVKYLGNALRCRFTGNFAAEGAHGLYLRRAVNCIFENTQSYAVYNNSYDGTFVNCLCRGNKLGNLRTGTGNVIYAFNSVFLKDGSTPRNKRCDFYNCIFDFDPTVPPSEAEAIIGTNGECRVFATGTVKFNADGSPTKGNPAVDAAIASYYDENFPASFNVHEKALDLNGNTRILGDAMDMGAVERISGTIDDNTWYVDAVSGNDANSGKTPEQAFKTLARASTNALMAAGATIYVAEGLYNEGIVPAQAGVDNTDSRMFADYRIDFVATGRREATIVEGAASQDTTCGIGSGAVRCCLLRGGSISGFTLRNGNVNVGTGAEGDQGGGIRCTSTDAYAYDCEIHHCNAVRGGGAQGVKLVRCYVHDNTCNVSGVTPARSIAGSLVGVYSCSGYNSVIEGQCYVGGVYLNCTLPGNCWGVGTKFVNCYVGGDGSGGSGVAATFTNCVCAGTFKEWSPHAGCVENAGTRFDKNWRPKDHDSAIINTADEALYASLFPAALAEFRDLDYAGGPRVLEDRMDIGAGEMLYEPKGAVIIFR